MDAMSGVLGGLAGALPLTTMSQNNGLIKMSGLHDCPSARALALRFGRIVASEVEVPIVIC